MWNIVNQKHSIAMQPFLSLTIFLSGIIITNAVMSNEELRNWILEREVKLYRFVNQLSDGFKYNRVDHAVSRICTKNSANKVMERSAGYVLHNSDFEAKIKSECPDLVAMSIHFGGPKNGTWINSYMDMQTAGVKRIGMFYCANEFGYCGANQPLYETKASANSPPIYTDDGRHARSTGQSVTIRCNIWVPEPSVENKNGTLVRNMLMERGSALYQLEQLESPKMNRVTTSYDELWQSLMPQQYFTRVGMVSYVVKECDAEEALEMCPELVKMDIYQSKAGNYLSHITKAGLTPVGALGTVGTDLCPSPSFYCAPRRGYCGADKPIYSIDSVQANSDVRYPTNENDLDDHLCQNEKYKSTFTSHCFGWTDDTYFRRFAL